VEDFDFHQIATELHNFCAVDLSAFYFDIRKDAVYCDAPKTLRRRAARTVMAELFSFITAWLAPITCFTAEEAVRTLRLAREAGGWDLVKLEVLGEARTLYPDMRETLKATETLVGEGFKPMVYCVDDPIAAKQLEEAGAVAIMPHMSSGRSTAAMLPQSLIARTRPGSFQSPNI